MRGVQTVKQLADFVHSTLKPRCQARQLSKEAVKWVASKTANKVGSCPEVQAG